MRAVGRGSAFAFTESLVRALGIRAYIGTLSAMAMLLFRRWYHYPNDRQWQTLHPATKR